MGDSGVTIDFQIINKKNILLIIIIHYMNILYDSGSVEGALHYY